MASCLIGWLAGSLTGSSGAVSNMNRFDCDFVVDCKFNCHKKCAPLLPKNCQGELNWIGGGWSICPLQTLPALFIHFLLIYLMLSYLLIVTHLLSVAIAGHILRGESLLREVIEGQMIGKRPRGR